MLSVTDGNKSNHLDLALTAAGAATTPGLYNPATGGFYLRNQNAGGIADTAFQYGPAGLGWLPITGDWDGDGKDTVGLYEPTNSVFFLRNENAGGFADITFAYGPAGSGWIPIAGDWNGDGIDTVGLYNPATGGWFLRNNHAPGFADISFAYGPAGSGWKPIVGDWNSDGIDTAGLYEPTAGGFFLRNEHAAGFATMAFAYGPGGSGWTPLAGDWNADGGDTVALHQRPGSSFHLRNVHQGGPADLSFGYGPPGSNWVPLAGHWTSSSPAPAGVVYTTPGQPHQSVPTRFTLAGKQADYRNEVGLYVVDDSAGRVGDLYPGDPGYAAAALGSTSRRVIFTANQAVGSVATIDLPGGSRFAVYLIQDGTTAAFLANNPGNQLGNLPHAFFSLAEVNPDHFDHLRQLSPTSFAWEDNTGGGDRDFNDSIVSFQFGAPVGIPDTQPPVVVIHSPLPGTVTNTQAHVTGRVTDDASGVASTETQIDSGPFFPVQLDAAGNFRFDTTLPLDGSADGQHTIHVRARDRAGNQTTPVETSFVLDTSVVPVNHPPLAANDSYLVAEDNTLVIGAATGLLANDIDPDGDLLTATVLTQVTHGMLSVNANGSFQYAPNTNFNGVEQFTYRASDGRGGTSDAQVTIEVLSINDPPENIAPLPSLSLTASQPSRSVSLTPLFTDVDIATNGDVLAYSVANSRPDLVTATIAGSTLTVTQEPGVSGQAMITVRATDLAGVFAEVSSLLSTSAMPLNRLPTAMPDSYAVDEDLTLTINAAGGLLANDIDPDGDTLTPTVITQPMHGVVMLNASGSFEYEPNDNYNGPDEFTYEVDDGRGGSSQALVSIQVRPINDAPTVVAPVEDIALDIHDPPRIVDLAGVFADVDIATNGDVLTYSVVNARPDLVQTVLTGSILTLAQLSPMGGETSITVRATDLAAAFVEDTFVANTIECAFTDDLAGWTVSQSGGGETGQGSVTAADCRAVMREGNSFVVTLARTFTVPEQPGSLSFTYDQLSFDTTDPALINDAFEVALLDEDGNPLVPTFTTGRDAFFNITEGLPAAFDASAVTILGATVIVAMTHIAPGTAATLVFRLVNNDSDTASTVTISDMDFPAGAVFLQATYTPGNPNPQGSADLAIHSRALAGLQSQQATTLTDDDVVPNAIISSASSVNPYMRVVELEFDSLPSAQGWVYENGGNGTPEANVFTVDGTTLFQNSLASPDGSAASNSYYFEGAVNSDFPFVIELRARVLEQNGNQSRHKGFGFFARTGAEVVIIGIGPHDIQQLLLNNTEVTIDSTIDNTVFHDYRLEGVPSIGADLFVDDMFVARLPREAYTESPRLYLGDLSASNNARAEVTHFRFTQLSSFVVSVTAQAANSQFPAGSHVLISGHASSLTQSGLGSRPIASVTVNGIPVESLDASRNFFALVPIVPGVNAFDVTATDSEGQAATTTLTLQGIEAGPTRIDFSQLADITGSFAVEYARTSFDDASRALYADSAVRNLGQFPANVPLLVGVLNISDPSVIPLNTAGMLPDGTPYYDFAGLVTGGELNPGAHTGTLSLAFFNPQREQFTYELVFLGKLNVPPAFNSVPKIEAIAGREYAYAATATDPDGDSLTFKLIAGPSGMTINDQTGLLSWTPSTSDVGNHDVTVQVSDGRGGTAQQHWVLSVITAPPNRPPVINSTPDLTATINAEYAYDVDALDPDFDPIEYAVLDGPEGMTIDPATGLITWTPTVADLNADAAPTETFGTAPGYRIEPYAQGLSLPAQIDVDSRGNLYVATGDGSAKPFKVSDGGQTVEGLGNSPISDPDSVLYDELVTISGVPGSLLVGSWSEIYAIRPNGDVDLLVSSVPNIESMQRDSAGRVVFVRWRPSNSSIASYDGNTVASLFAPVTEGVDIVLDSHDRVLQHGIDGVIRMYSLQGELLDPSYASGFHEFGYNAVGRGGFWGRDLYVAANCGNGVWSRRSDVFERLRQRPYPAAGSGPGDPRFGPRRVPRNRRGI
ncbi:MAG: tandem-95 repeat protein [Planctomycetes bacterium]|nr:tandem-95 repeat protein [Planctomycetota bacterium]